MKIIFDDTTISIQNVSLDKHVIAGTDKDGDIVFVRRNLSGNGGLVAQIMNRSSLESANSYNKGSTVDDLLKINDITWHAFDSIHEFFVWAAEETNE